MDIALVPFSVPPVEMRYRRGFIELLSRNEKLVFCIDAVQRLCEFLMKDDSML